MFKLTLLGAAAVAAIALGFGDADATQGTRTFSVTIANVSTDDALALPDGSAIRAPIAPGAYAIISGDDRVIRAGEPVGDTGLEPLSEDGNAEPLIASLKATPGVRVAGLFVPGQSFQVEVQPGDRLVFASMFVQSNDLFYAPRSGAVDLFDGNGMPVSGDLTETVALWDAGTEVNQQPGVGSEQAPRQSGPNTGVDENGVVRLVADGFTYPEVDQVIRLSIEPQ